MAVTSVISSIAGAARKFSGKPLELSSKLMGAASIVSVLYDTHQNGIERAIVTDRLDTAKRYENNYKIYSSMNGSSPFLSDVKNLWYSVQLSSMHHIISKTGGYLKGALKTLAGGSIELILAAAALKSKKFPVLGKTAGVLLGLSAAKTFLYDVMGLGRNKKQ